MDLKSIFISHQFHHYKEIDELKIKLKELGWNISIFSIPEHDSFDLNRKKQIEVELKNLIENSEVILTLARTTIDNSFWVVNELKYAKNSNKIIIGIIPSEYKKPIPLFIEKACNDYSEFEINNIIQTLKNNYK